MKLNVKQTIKIGLGFLTVMMLWQVYNWFVPLYLNDFLSGVLKLDKMVIGIVMALDNLFALFMMPIIGKASDKTNTKIGKRMPYIIVGILLSALFFVLLPFIFKLNNTFLLLLDILLVLISMNIYRSPVVSLMPDVTPQKLRNKANSIINILGGGGVVIGYLAVILFYDKTDLSSIKNVIPFIITSLIMFICLMLMLITINENKMRSEYKAILKANNIDEELDKEETKEHSTALKTKKKNVFIFLLVIFFVYMANNAVETWMSLYTEEVFVGDIKLPFNISVDSLPLVCAGLGSFIMAIPSALIADKIGRKRTIGIGILVMAGSYFLIALTNINFGFSYFLIIPFLMCGLGLSLITINIYPLIVENCKEDEIGVYTSKYYTSTMLAQSITPALSGLIMSNLLFSTMKPLFIYCFIMMLIAFILINAKIEKDELNK